MSDSCTIFQLVVSDHEFGGVLHHGEPRLESKGEMMIKKKKTLIRQYHRREDTEERFAQNTAASVPLLMVSNVYRQCWVFLADVRKTTLWKIHKKFASNTTAKKAFVSLIVLGMLFPFKFFFFFLEQKVIFFHSLALVRG